MYTFRMSREGCKFNLDTVSGALDYCRYMGWLEKSNIEMEIDEKTMETCNITIKNINIDKNDKILEFLNKYNINNIDKDELDDLLLKQKIRNKLKRNSMAYAEGSIINGNEVCPGDIIITENLYNKANIYEIIGYDIFSRKHTVKNLSRINSKNITVFLKLINFSIVTSKKLKAEIQSFDKKLLKKFISVKEQITVHITGDHIIPFYKTTFNSPEYKKRLDSVLIDENVYNWKPLDDMIDLELGLDNGENALYDYNDPVYDLNEPLVDTNPDLDIDTYLNSGNLPINTINESEYKTNPFYDLETLFINNNTSSSNTSIIPNDHDSSYNEYEEMKMNDINIVKFYDDKPINNLYPDCLRIVTYESSSPDSHTTDIIPYNNSIIEEKNSETEIKCLLDKISKRGTERLDQMNSTQNFLDNIRQYPLINIINKSVNDQGEDSVEDWSDYSDDFEEESIEENIEIESNYNPDLDDNLYNHNKQIKSIVTLGEFTRCYIERKHINSIIIQSFIRGAIERRIYNNYLHSVKTIQGAARVWNSRREVNLITLVDDLKKEIPENNLELIKDELSEDPEQSMEAPLNKTYIEGSKANIPEKTIEQEIIENAKKELNKEEGSSCSIM